MTQTEQHAAPAVETTRLRMLDTVERPFKVFRGYDDKGEPVVDSNVVRLDKDQEYVVPAPAARHLISLGFAEMVTGEADASE